MKIYRIENREHGGPYHNSITHDLLNHHNGCRHHPIPQDDHIDWEACFSSGWICGFVSMQQLKNWFDLEDLAICKAHGYHIVEYDVDEEDVACGEHQCIFWPDGKPEEVVQYRQENSSLLCA